MSGWLRRRAAPHPLLVAVPGATVVRWAVERELRERGWPIARSPAEADLLVVCGAPGERLRAAVDVVWRSMASPRARVEVLDVARVAADLDAARIRLVDAAAQRVDAAGRTAQAPPDPSAADAHGHDGHDGDGHDHDGYGHDDQDTRSHAAHGHDAQAHDQPSGDDPGTYGNDAHDAHDAHGHDVHSPDPHGHDADDHEMPGHEMPSHDMQGMNGHDMHHMHGGEVAGLPMADRAPDRDGLALDRIHATLGPVLGDWPAGLAARLVLQGDVVQDVEIEVLDPTPEQDAPGSVQAAALDDLGVLLSVCGWDVAARMARRLRDDAVAGSLDPARLRRFTRGVRRSRTLRWATDGLGLLDGHDATARWRHWLDVAEGGDAPTTRPELSPDLLVGCELAAVRVVVASFGGNPVAVTAARSDA